MRRVVDSGERKNARQSRLARALRNSDTYGHGQYTIGAAVWNSRAAAALSISFSGGLSQFSCQRKWDCPLCRGTADQFSPSVGGEFNRPIVRKPPQNRRLESPPTDTDIRQVFSSRDIAAAPEKQGTPSRLLSRPPRRGTSEQHKAGVPIWKTGLHCFVQSRTVAPWFAGLVEAGNWTLERQFR